MERVKKFIDNVIYYAIVTIIWAVIIGALGALWWLDNVRFTF